jgi:SAM-dependent methyltransferase
MTSDDRLASDRFPRASKYDPDWVIAGASGGANSLWLAEWLAEALHLRSGMRVLDLGCGRGASSIFLHREFGVQVWAADLWHPVTERFQRIRDADAEGAVWPIHADARSLPFAADFFDVVVCIDSFVYFGTDDLYLGYLARFVKPGGIVAHAGAGLMREIDGPVPEHLRSWWEPSLWCLHSAPWWHRHWQRTGIVDIEVADAMPEGWRAWLDWQRTVCPDNRTEIDALEADHGNYLGYVRVVGRRRVDAKLDEPIVSVPAEYTKKALLRGHRPNAVPFTSNTCSFASDVAHESSRLPGFLGALGDASHVVPRRVFDRDDDDIAVLHGVEGQVGESLEEDEPRARDVGVFGPPERHLGNQLDGLSERRHHP